MKIYVTTAPMRLQTMNSYIANDVTWQNIAVEPASRNIGTITNTACAVITSVAFIPPNRHVIKCIRGFISSICKNATQNKFLGNLCFISFFLKNKTTWRNLEVLSRSDDKIMTAEGGKIFENASSNIIFNDELNQKFMNNYIIQYY